MHWSLNALLPPGFGICRGSSFSLLRFDLRQLNVNRFHGDTFPQDVAGPTQTRTVQAGPRTTAVVLLSGDGDLKDENFIINEKGVCNIEIEIRMATLFETGMQGLRSGMLARQRL